MPLEVEARGTEAGAGLALGFGRADSVGDVDGLGLGLGRGKGVGAEVVISGSCLMVTVGFRLAGGVDMMTAAAELDNWN